MHFNQLSGADWFLLAQHEILLFAAVLFAIGLLDELAVDLAYVLLRFSGVARTRHVDDRLLIGAPLGGRVAVFIPAWQEASVIGHTVAHALSAWPQQELALYVGCYPDDPETYAAAQAAGKGDARLRLVVHDRAGPTSKADCLNRLYAALCTDEAGWGAPVHMVVLQDAEDMVDPAALKLLSDTVHDFDFVQLPVIALPHPGSPWIGGHYIDEFAEAHARTMVVRGALNAAVPGAGVGCAVERKMLDRLACEQGTPFAAHSLTEDYELGLHVGALGGRGCFLRARGADGRLIGTRAYFPADRDTAVRQKTRWMSGISLHGWDRISLHGSMAAWWMQLRDRRGPFSAFLLAIAYGLLIVAPAGWFLVETGLANPRPMPDAIKALLIFNLAGLFWRVALRGCFTAREHGWREGLIALPRMAVSNIIAIMAGWRAVRSYLKTLRGHTVPWDKTHHTLHPAMRPFTKRGV